MGAGGRGGGEGNGNGSGNRRREKGENEGGTGGSVPSLPAATHKAQTPGQTKFFHLYFFHPLFCDVINGVEVRGGKERKTFKSMGL